VRFHPRVRANVNRKLRRCATKIQGVVAFDINKLVNDDGDEEDSVEILPEAGATTSPITDGSAAAVAKELAALTARVDREEVAAEVSRQQMQECLDEIQATLRLLLAQQKSI
jgi:hypothetical protein